MPQMKPMNWMFLICYTLIMYMFTNKFLYFFYMKYLNEMNIIFKSFKKFNLKW